MANIEPSVGFTRALRPSVPKLDTPPMPISESVQALHSLSSSFCLSALPLPGVFCSSFAPARCLAFEVKGLGVRKVRPLSKLRQLDLCQLASHMNSQTEDSCNYAHSAIELKTWMVQRQTGEDSVTAVVAGSGL